MTTALYRRYRPDTFDQVIGQEHVTEPLKAALRANRVTHAYLFSGPRGCGKTTSARILARCLNCAQGPTDTPCGQCESCRELATGGPGSLDVVEIDAASHGGVDDARDLRERATFAPVRDRYKIFIIDEAHMVTNQGFNALLKLVEEPPEHVKFVFATTEPERVIGTIRSRTHHYPFRLVPPDVLGPYLTTLCAEEHISVGEGVLTHTGDGFHLTGCGGALDYRQKPLASYSLYSDYYWYELGDMICIGNPDVLYYCFPKNSGDIVAKTRLAAEELYKIKKEEKKSKISL